MRGAIEYLQSLKKQCLKSNRDCRNCPLGQEKNILDTKCPCLTPAWQWDTKKIAKMVKATKKER